MVLEEREGEIRGLRGGEGRGEEVGSRGPGSMYMKGKRG